MPPRDGLGLPKAVRGIKLTAGEMQVLERAGAGLSGQQIAAALGIGLDRVKDIKQNIKRKIGLDQHASTEDMLLQARSIGFIR
jgi:DNA-binding CsgD family transcriptional regulator